MTFKILVVDDEIPFELMVQKIFRTEIKEELYHFLFARNGLEALDILRSELDVDLLVTDINMPEMDGLTLLSEVCRDFPDVVTVVVSAYGDLDNIRHTMNSGAFDFLVKPVDRRDFRKTVAKCIDQVRRIQELREARHHKDRTQQELVRHLKRMDLLKDEFLVSVSHELLTPLNGIVGIADSVADGAVGPIGESVRDNLRMIVSCGKRLTSLVHDVLDFSKLKHSEIKLDIRPLDIRPIIGVVLSLSKPLLADKSVALVAHFPENLGPVLADENRLQQVLHNLIGNAIKFTPGGAITVEVTEQEARIAVSISDTGIGIADDQLEEIFRAFERLDNSDIQAYGGTGLGLSISRQLIQLQGGDIEVTSALGEGSRFTFFLPRAEGAQAPNHPDTPSLITWEMEESVTTIEMPKPEGNAGYFRLLAVDDEPSNLQVLANHFAMQNYHLDVARDGREALAMVEAYPDYDLVLLDVMMPGMSGYEVCRTLRERHSLFELPILIITAKNHPRSYLEGLESGANDYLPKPFDKRELLARAKTLLILKQAVRQAINHNRRLEAERLKRGMAENLRRITETLTSTLELKLVLSRFLDSLEAVAPFQRSVIALVNEDVLEPATLHGYETLSKEDLEAVLHVTSQVFNRLAKQREARLFSPVEEGWEQSDIMAKSSLLGVPFISHGEVIGLIMLERLERIPFNAQESLLVSTFAAQAAIAIENARLFEKMQTMAKTEELTGLNNRRHFFVLGRQLFDDSKRRGRDLAAIMLDVDHFKRFNDTYGHALGDEVLQVVAQRIRIACRKTDIIGRYGGEEFAILLPDTSLDIARDVAERLRTEIQKEFIPEETDKRIVITASLGVAQLTNHSKTLADLLRRADQALYLAKNMGRNRTLTYADIVMR